MVLGIKMQSCYNCVDINKISFLYELYSINEQETLKVCADLFIYFFVKNIN